MSRLMSGTTLAKVSQIRGNVSDIYKCLVMPRLEPPTLKQNHRAESCVHLQRCRDVYTPQEPGRKCCCVLFTGQFTTSRKVRSEKHRMHMQKMGRPLQPSAGCSYSTGLSPAETCTSVSHLSRQSSNVEPERHYTIWYK